MYKRQIMDHLTLNNIADAATLQLSLQLGVETEWAGLDRARVERALESLKEQWAVYEAWPGSFQRF